MTKLLQFILRINVMWVFCALCQAAPNTDVPIQITADKAKYDHNQGIATYTGNVVMHQGERNLYCNKLQIFRNAQNKIHLLLANGTPAHFDSDLNGDRPGTGSAEIIKYYPQTQKVDLFNDATLTQNGDTVSGAKLTYNFVTEELQSTGQDRTTVILQPKRVP